MVWYGGFFLHVEIFRRRGRSIKARSRPLSVVGLLMDIGCLINLCTCICSIQTLKGGKTAIKGGGGRFPLLALCTCRKTLDYGKYMYIDMYTILI
jgi:hypothetical protein